MRHRKVTSCFAQDWLGGGFDMPDACRQPLVDAKSLQGTRCRPDGCDGCTFVCPCGCECPPANGWQCGAWKIATEPRGAHTYRNETNFAELEQCNSDGVLPSSLSFSQQHLGPGQVDAFSRSPPSSSHQD